MGGIRIEGERERERSDRLTLVGISLIMLFLSIVETRVEAYSETMLFSGESPSAAARRVSITLARISASGSSRPRRSRGISLNGWMLGLVTSHKRSLEDYTHYRHFVCICRFRYRLNQGSQGDEIGGLLVRL